MWLFLRELPALDAAKVPTKVEIPAVNAEALEQMKVLDSICSTYLTKAVSGLTADQEAKLPPYRQKYLKWARDVSSNVKPVEDLSKAGASIPLLKTELEAITRAGENLGKLLVDPLAAQAILFNDNLPERLYKEALTFAPMVEELAKVFESVIRTAAEKDGRKVFRILEIGAGTGGLSAKLFKVRLEEYLEFTS